MTTKQSDTTTDDRGYGERDWGAELKAERIRRGLTQAQAARELGMGATTYLGWEHGKSGGRNRRSWPTCERIDAWLAGHFEPEPEPEPVSGPDIRAERKKRGLSQAAAAEQARVGRTTFAEWESRGYETLATIAPVSAPARKTKELIDEWLREPVAEPERPVYDREHELPPEPEPEPERPDPEIETYRAIAAAIPDHRPALAQALLSFAAKLAERKWRERGPKGPPPDPESGALPKALVEVREALHTLSEESATVREAVRAFVLESKPAMGAAELREALDGLATEAQATRALVRELAARLPTEAPAGPSPVLLDEVRALRAGFASLTAALQAESAANAKMRTRAGLIWAEHQRLLEQREEELRAMDRAFMERAERQSQEAGVEKNPSHWTV